MANIRLSDSAEDVSRRATLIIKRFDDLTRLAHALGFRSERIALMQVEESMQDSVCIDLSKKVETKYGVNKVSTFDGQHSDCNALESMCDAAIREKRMLLLISHVNQFCPAASRDVKKAELQVTQFLKTALRLRDDDCDGLIILGLISDPRTVSQTVLNSPLVNIDNGPM